MAESECLKLSDALAGPILVAGHRDAILEECLGDAAPVDLPDFGPAWRVRAFGSSQQLADGAHPPPPAGVHQHPHSQSASSLHARHPPPPPGPGPARRVSRPAPAPPLSDALFSSSTSDLEKLRRNRILPALSRHRNTEHLHLSDDHLDARRPRGPDAGGERRPRRVRDVAELDASRLFRFGDFDGARREEPSPSRPGEEDDKVSPFDVTPSDRDRDYGSIDPRFKNVRN